MSNSIRALYAACAVVMIFVVASFFPPPERTRVDPPGTVIAPRPPVAAPAAAYRPTTMAVQVSVSDYTERRPVRGAEVWLRGVGSWFPDLRHGGDVRTYAGLRIGATDTLYFYPAGRDVPELRVPVSLADSLCGAGCVRDAVRLEVWDDRFEAWGPPVPGGAAVVRRR